MNEIFAYPSYFKNPFFQIKEKPIPDQGISPDVHPVIFERKNTLIMSTRSAPIDS
jgi:hypothetical protein